MLGTFLGIVVAIAICFALIVAVFRYSERRIRAYRVSTPSPAEAKIEAMLKDFGTSQAFDVARLLWDEKNDIHLEKELREVQNSRLLEVVGSHRDPTFSPAYRFFWRLSKKDDSHADRMLVLPFKQSFFIATEKQGDTGYLVIYKEVQETKHRIVIKPDMHLHEASDHRVESNAFNRKYIFEGTERRMLTEIFDPVLIEQIQKERFLDFFFRLGDKVAVLAVFGPLTITQIIQHYHLMEKIHSRFVKAEKFFSKI